MVCFHIFYLLFSYGLFSHMLPFIIIWYLIIFLLLYDLFLHILPFIIICFFSHILPFIIIWSVFTYFTFYYYMVCFHIFYLLLSYGLFSHILPFIIIWFVFIYFRRQIQWSTYICTSELYSAEKKHSVKNMNK